MTFSKVFIFCALLVSVKTKVIASRRTVHSVQVIDYFARIVSGLSKQIQINGKFI